MDPGHAIVNREINTFRKIDASVLLGLGRDRVIDHEASSNYASSTGHLADISFHNGMVSLTISIIRWKGYIQIYAQAEPEGKINCKYP